MNYTIEEKFILQLKFNHEFKVSKYEDVLKNNPKDIDQLNYEMSMLSLFIDVIQDDGLDKILDFNSSLYTTREGLRFQDLVTHKLKCLIKSMAITNYYKDGKKDDVDKILMYDLPKDLVELINQYPNELEQFIQNINVNLLMDYYVYQHKLFDMVEKVQELHYQ